ncbi:MAG: hypothetical protein K2J09_01615, partial [Muribaculaceae bacterium]|nr:hypothetical protein [Muribaculaceae bacterium]
AEQAWLEHGYEVTGYPLALVTRRADQFRLDRLKEAWEYRNGPQDDILVPAGTATTAYKVAGRLQYAEYTYQLSYDLKRAEDNQVAAQWRGYQSMYYPYPPKEIIKNPNIKRVSAMN